MVKGLEALGLEVHLILMAGGAGDPMNPADESAVVDCLVECLAAASKHGIKTVSSTSLEPWMAPDAKRKEGADFEAAHQRASGGAALFGRSWTSTASRQSMMGTAIQADKQLYKAKNKGRDQVAHVLLDGSENDQ